MTQPPVRPAEQRKKDALYRLEHDADAWVSTADLETGAPYMVPLSFLWNGSSLLLATAASAPTARNLSLSGTGPPRHGETRDVVLVEGTAQVVRLAELSAAEETRSRRRPGSIRARSRCAYLLLPHQSAQAPGVARGQRDRRPRPDRGRPLDGGLSHRRTPGRQMSDIGGRASDGRRSPRGATARLPFRAPDGPDSPDGRRTPACRTSRPVSLTYGRARPFDRRSPTSRARGAGSRGAAGRTWRERRG